eukprot:Nk52_evm32s1737 gene=Nk52_evmTU32s1737
MSVDAEGPHIASNTQSIVPDVVVFDASVGTHPVRDLFSIGDTIGSGGFAKVRKGVHKVTGEPVAIKIVNKAVLKGPTAKNRLVNEIEAMKTLNHENICELYGVIETENSVYLLLEYAPGGELFDYIVSRGKLKEVEARKYFVQILNALNYCHQNGIVHRDLKPENLLLDDDMNIKMIDFGLAGSRCDPFQDFLQTACGSISYAAPELLESKAYLGSKADMWSLGVLLYALVCGSLPLDQGLGSSARAKALREGKIQFPAHLSPQVLEVLQGLLKYEAQERLTFDEIWELEWLDCCTNTCEGLTKPKLCQIDQAIEWTCDVNKIVDKELRAMVANKTLNSYVLFYNLALLAISRNNDRYKQYLAHSKGLSRSASNSESQVESSNSTVQGRDDTARLSLSLGPTCNESSADRSGKSQMEIIREHEMNHKTADASIMHDSNPFVFPSAVNQSSENNVSKSKPRSPNATQQPEKLPTINSTNSRRKSVDMGHISTFRSQPRTTRSEDQNNSGHINGLPARKNSLTKGKEGFSNFFNSLIKITKPSTSDVSTLGPPEITGKSFSVSTTTSAPPDEVVEQVKNVLEKSSELTFKQFGYMFKIKKKDGMDKTVLGFKLTICRLRDLNMTGIKFGRFKGDTWLYKEKCQEILKSMKLLNTE